MLKRFFFSACVLALLTLTSCVPEAKFPLSDIRDAKFDEFSEVPRGGKKNTFIKDPVLDHLFYHIFCDILVSKTPYSAMVSEFIKADKKVQNAFDKELRSRIYDTLYEAHGGRR